MWKKSILTLLLIVMANIAVAEQKQVTIKYHKGTRTEQNMEK